MIDFFKAKEEQEKKREELLELSVILPVFGKTVIVDYRGQVQCNYLGKNVPIQLLLPSYDCKLELNIELLTSIICQFHDKDICEGVNVQDKNLKFKSESVYIDATYKWRHKNCSIILPEGNKKICKSCNLVNQLFSNKKYRRKSKPLKRISLRVTPSKKENLKHLRKRNSLKQRINTKLGEKINQLESIIEDYKKKLENLYEESILQQISSHTHKLLVREILAASKCKDSRGNRYSDNWIMLCLLLHIKSPSGYSFLRDNNIMPLPCVRTVRNYLSNISTSCGFDDNFFELFKKRLESKNVMQKHGLIVFDEISVRENLAVKSRTLSYSGLVDFGKEDEVCSELPKATTLDDLANHGLVLLFQPLADNYSQPIAVFASRGPVKGLTLVDPVEGPVKWSHFKILHDYDKMISNTKLRLCPKLSDNHLDLRNSSLKMRVLSNSVAIGLTMLKKIKSLRFNKIFDALNRKIPFQGVNLESNDYKILQESLLWLNNWELKFETGEVQQDQFLSDNTAEGLRVTLNSTIEIIKYLIEEFNFSYILTGKVTQDNL
ncbi:hypothetical protein ACI65C_006429 [Semiaphis heraclei]